jgi:hypothetical protein
MNPLPDARSEIDELFGATVLTTESCSTGCSRALTSFQPMLESMLCATLRAGINLPGSGLHESGLLHLGRMRNRYQVPTERAAPKSWRHSALSPSVSASQYFTAIVGSKSGRSAARREAGKL